jgi:hypothetical protein
MVCVLRITLADALLAFFCSNHYALNWIMRSVHMVHAVPSTYLLQIYPSTIHSTFTLGFSSNISSPALICCSLNYCSFECMMVASWDLGLFALHAVELITHIDQIHEGEGEVAAWVVRLVLCT